MLHWAILLMNTIHRQPSQNTQLQECLIFSNSEIQCGAWDVLEPERLVGNTGFTTYQAYDLDSLWVSLCSL